MSKTITLEKPLSSPKGDISVITMREPTFGDFMKFGETHVFARNRDGTIYTAESIDVIRQYVEALVDCDPLLLAQVSLRDARKFKNAVLDFFEQSNPELSP